MKRARWVWLTGAALALVACGDSNGPSISSDFEDPLSGGATTIADATSGAFKRPAPNLSTAHLDIHLAGDAAFEANFVAAPALVNPGLGPLFNNVACGGCHTNDGRGRPPIGNEALQSMLFRISLPGAAVDGGPLAVPSLGTQFQQRSVVGFNPEGTVNITYAEQPGTFSDGATYSLRNPTYTLTNPNGLLAGTLLSPRVAPPNFGLGLLEAIPEATILANADPNDGDGDGISGRANYVPNSAAGGVVTLGRFGLKANTPTLLAQTVGAYSNDMGITSTILAHEGCEGLDPICAPHTAEVNDSVVAAVVFYSQTLAVPARRNVGAADVRQGAAVFVAAKCSSCHIPTMQTGTLAGIPEVSNQRIHAYTDLLLHDMGAGLADGRTDYVATGSEWRTPPLWGIGMTALVNGHTNFLHDGRARGLMEAVMWHGGEALASRNYVASLSASDRAALIAFLNSL